MNVITSIFNRASEAIGGITSKFGKTVVKDTEEVAGNLERDADDIATGVEKHNPLKDLDDDEDKISHVFDGDDDEGGNFDFGKAVDTASNFPINQHKDKYDKQFDKGFGTGSGSSVNLDEMDDIPTADSGDDLW